MTLLPDKREGEHIFIQIGRSVMHHMFIRNVNLVYGVAEIQCARRIEMEIHSFRSIVTWVLF